MIVSKEYKYVFVEIPHTASTAISRELCENYKGQSILFKHAHYRDFLKIALGEEKSYLVFAGIRNPLDVIVTRYFKRKTDHEGFFSSPEHWQKNRGHVTNKALHEYRFIHEQNADYPAYFHRFFRYPHDSWGCPSPDDFDFVIRFEHLQDDFAGLLQRLGIPQVRPLPWTNKTAGKETDFWSYYPPEIRKQAVWCFGPYLDLWGYRFPPEWGVDSIPVTATWAFRLFRLFRKTLIRTGFRFRAV
jgi:hypothetical protein